ncbi:MAG: hypothetical protein COA54_11495 [Thiotrichaceae bacterium]|nr:MAG: hypothetical protein COA54_11495 [Thiotrichaceae bacterium]
MKYKTICLIIFSLILLQGCVAIQSFPTVARAGDTVTLALGSSDQINIADTTVTYTPDGGVAVDLTSNVRSIFKLYPDRASPAWSFSAASGIPVTSGHSASVDIMVLDLPPGLVPGTGVIRVQNNAVYPIFSDIPSDADVAIEIVPGVGSPAAFAYSLFGNATAGNFTSLEAAPHFRIKPDFEPNAWYQAPTYAAAELTISGTLNAAALAATESQVTGQLRIIVDEMPTSLASQKQVSWARNGGDITINYLSPTGKMAYYETTVAVFFAASNYSFTATPNVSIRYFDIDGNVVTGPPVFIKSCTNATGCI